MSGPQTSEEAPAKIRVWLVEDHDLLRRSLHRLCSGAEGLECQHNFGNAEAMLSTLAAQVKLDEPPDVLLMDVGLPGRSGLDVIHDVLALAPKCRVVILTVFEDEEKIGTAISAGACGYLLKTARPPEVIAAIHEAAGGGAPMSPKVASRVVHLLAALTKKSDPVKLSPRESEILALIVEGLTAKEIAARLDVSIHTIDSHTRHTFKKLGVHSRSAAVARAIRDGMV